LLHQHDNLTSKINCQRDRENTTGKTPCQMMVKQDVNKAEGSYKERKRVNNELFTLLSLFGSNSLSQFISKIVTWLVLWFWFISHQVPP
jgi:hypothetical protein